MALFRRKNDTPTWNETPYNRDDTPEQKGKNFNAQIVENGGTLSEADGVKKKEDTPTGKGRHKK